MKFLKNFLIVLFLIVLDQLTKYYFFGKQIILFEYFSFRFISNTGATFGIFKGYNLLFIFISIFIIILLLCYYKKFKNNPIALNLVLAGAIGNLIDRIFRGYVVDFIDLKFWPVFNLADSFIVIGVLLILYYNLKGKD